MEDYHVISMDSIDSEAIDHQYLHVDDIPWANNKYGLQMPTKKMENFTFSSQQGS